MDAFFIPHGQGFGAQVHTRGPWSNAHQHGGPPAALLARAMELEAGPRTDWQPVRFLMEFLKPVPVAQLEVRTSVARATRRVRTLRAVLSSSGVDVCQAECVFIARATVPTPDAARSAQRLTPAPDALAPYTFPFFQAEVGYHTAMDLRLPREAWGGRTCAAWMRARVPVVPGETPSPLQRVVLACDASSGVAPPVDISKFTFLNPELVVHLWRDLEGEWVGVDAFSEAGPSGAGVARSTVYDAQGSCAASAQALLVELR